MSVNTAFNTNLRLGAALLAVAALAACGGVVSAPMSGAKAESGASAPHSAASAPQAGKGPYGVKAGSYEMSMAGGMKSTTYFEDNGSKQAIYTEMGGKTMSMSFMLGDGFMVNCIPMMKSCTKTALTGAASAPMGSAPAVDRKSIEGKEIAGKKCEGWEVTVAGVTSKSWTYENIPMGMESGATKMEVTKFSEEAPAADKFAVPAGYTVK